MLENEGVQQVIGKDTNKQTDARTHERTHQPTNGRLGPPRAKPALRSGLPCATVSIAQQRLPTACAFGAERPCVLPCRAALHGGR